jgi:hypothetical protein
MYLEPRGSSQFTWSATIDVPFFSSFNDQITWKIVPFAVSCTSCS